MLSNKEFSHSHTLHLRTSTQTYLAWRHSPTPILGLALPPLRFPQPSSPPSHVALRHPAHVSAHACDGVSGVSPLPFPSREQVDQQQRTSPG